MVNALTSSFIVLSSFLSIYVPDRLLRTTAERPHKKTA
ncbi:hypothetical protein CHCC5025_2346 [Bacillus licheniformis]|nr:hypothetical protein B4091_4516 [Bacillus licheniformis]TWJ44778.1 hypothetical protein CHCC5025_2346 [Bacillus licheniformis]TWJ68159.1 hypothetical protein CHCC5020_1403 [Bacillus licheniformis]TWK04853.1 hypothetical protein CHCC20442_3009 [Bacillus licheniformis]TWK21160.1 hypothetical protein CHCC20373_3820 [Bacillus licheniformis]